MSQESTTFRRPLRIIINRKAGTARGAGPETLVASLRAAADEIGCAVEIGVFSGESILAEIDRIKARRDVDRMIVGGGDGTVSTAAARLAGTGIALGVLPLGTMNLFARVLKVPLEPAAALKSLLRGEIDRVDTGSANGRLFLHQVSLGLQPEMIAQREGLSYASRAGKIAATLRAFAHVLYAPRSLRLEARTPEDGPWRIETPALIVSNNLHETGLPPMPLRLDQGVLGVYWLKSASWADLLNLSKDVALGQWHGSTAMEVRELTRIIVSRARGRWRPLTVSIDGELVRVRGELDIAIRPKSLEVLKPREQPGPA